jgi:hypothetical protein
MMLLRLVGPHTRYQWIVKRARNEPGTHQGVESRRTL